MVLYTFLFDKILCMGCPRKSHFKTILHGVVYLTQFIVLENHNNINRIIQVFAFGIFARKEKMFVFLKRDHVFFPVTIFVGLRSRGIP